VNGLELPVDISELIALVISTMFVLPPAPAAIPDSKINPIDRVLAVDVSSNPVIVGLLPPPPVKETANWLGPPGVTKSNSLKY